MKVRQGFVSNSSSSSFIFAVDSEINTVEDVKTHILKEDDGDKIISISGWRNTTTHTIDEIAETILKSKHSYKTNLRERIAEVVFQDTETKYINSDGKEDWRDPVTGIISVASYYKNCDSIIDLFGTDVEIVKYIDRANSIISKARSSKSIFRKADIAKKISTRDLYNMFKKENKNLVGFEFEDHTTIGSYLENDHCFESAYIKIENH